MDQPSQEDYKDILTEIIKKQAIILGPQIAVLKARNVAGVTVSDDGTVTSIVGDSNTAMQLLIEQYVSLSGEIVKNAVNSVFAKYPALKKV